MASLGEISVDLVAKTGGFEATMAKAANSAAGAGAAVASLGAAAVVAAAAMAGAAVAAAASLVKEIAGLGDEAAKAASQMGTTAEVVQELTHAAEISGSGLEDLRKGFKTLNKNAVDAADGVKESADAFKRVGVSVKDASGQLKTSEQLFTESAQAISEMSNSTEQAAAAQEIFGKSGTKLIPLLKEGAAGIGELRQEARDLGIVMSNDAAATSERFNDTLDRLNKSFEGIKIKIGVAMLPAFTQLADVVLRVTRHFFESVDVSAYMRQGIDILTRATLNLIRGLDTFAPVISAFIAAVRVAANIGQLWVTGLVSIGTLIGGLAATIAQFVTGSLSGFVGGVSEVARALGKDELADSLAKAEKGIASVADTMGGVADGAFASLSDRVQSAAVDFGDIDDAISDLASGSTTSALRDTLGSIEDAMNSVGDATFDTADKFKSGADTMVGSAKKIESALKDVALAYADAFLAEQKLGRDVGKATAADQARTSAGFSAAINETNANVNAYDKTARARELGKSGTGAADAAGAMGGMGGETGKLLSSVSAASTAMGGLASAAGGIVGIFVELWTSSSKFGEIMGMISGVFKDVFGPLVDGILRDLMDVLKPIVGLFHAIAPVLRVVFTVLNPFGIALKLVAELFRALAKPIESFVRAVKRVVNQIRVFIANIGRKKKNKAYVDENGDIIDPKGKIGSYESGPKIDTQNALASTAEATQDLGDAAKRAAVSLGQISPHVQNLTNELLKAGNAFAGIRDPEATLGMGSGAKQVWGDLLDSIGRVTGAQNDNADAVREATSALTNVPEIFRANLRRGQVGAGSTGGGGSAGFSGSTGGSVYIAGNVTVVGGDPDEFSKNLRRQRFVRSGDSYDGIAASGGIMAAG